MATIEQVIKLLRHDEAKHRQKAILWLAKSGDERAIEGLEWAAANDPEMRLRELARQGIEQVRGDIDTRSVLDDISAIDEDDLFSDLPPIESESQSGGFSYSGYAESVERDEPRPISNRAKALINEAMDDHLNERDDLALTKLLQALDWDPAARTHVKTLNLASAIMGIPGEEAIARLNDPDTREDLLKRLSEQVKTRQKNTSDPTWMHVGIAIAIMTVINIVGAVLLTQVAFDYFFPLFEEVIRLPEYQELLREADSQDELRLLLEELNSAGGIITASIIGSTLITIVLTMVNFIAVHFAAVNFFEGKRSLPVTLNPLVVLHTVYSFLGFVLFGIILYMLPNNLDFYMNLEATIENDPEAFTGTILAITCPAALLSVSVPLVQSVIVGRAQKIGCWRGCASVFIGWVVYYVLYYAFQLFMQMISAIASL